MTVLVFADKAKADSVMFEIANTPFGKVWTWYDPDNPTVNKIQYAMSADGRCASAHEFGEQDRAWLEIYTAGMTGVHVLDSLPSDWQYPTPQI